MTLKGDASSSTPLTTVGVAVVEYRGYYLVGIRQGAVPLAGFAEFPGGKCNSGESPAECAIRECREETGLSVVATEQLMHCVFEYAHGVVDLHFWLCRPDGPVETGGELHGFRWISKTELPSLQFPEANRPLIERLSQGRS